MSCEEIPRALPTGRAILGTAKLFDERRPELPEKFCSRREAKDLCRPPRLTIWVKSTAKREKGQERTPGLTGIVEMEKKLLEIYDRLYRRFGPQGWWPAETDFEVAVGAILTQNTSWLNVERAIANLKKARALSFRRMRALGVKRLARLIRPAGYYNIKARRLKHFLEFLDKNYGGSLKSMRKKTTAALRRELLSVHGIGPETADSILLYALSRPVFVVDAYTRRILSRHRLIREPLDYHEVQEFFMGHLRPDVRLFNEYHALFVKCAKDFCRKKKADCPACPLDEKK